MLRRLTTKSLTKRTFAAEASSEPLVKTALYDLHRELGGDMVPFAGYELPVLYKGESGGVMKEHLWCRSEGKASLFDVSHMGQVRVVYPLLLIDYTRRTFLSSHYILILCRLNGTERIASSSWKRLWLVILPV